MTQTAFNWLLAATLVAVMAAVQHLDASDFERHAAAERDEWAQAIQQCHRAYGPATQPEYDDHDRLICRSRRAA
jgi:DMSO/TMAO reductase YedYZ molybdopterin-dependent catalytic subunit